MAEPVALRYPSEAHVHGAHESLMRANYLGSTDLGGALGNWQTHSSTARTCGHNEDTAPCSQTDDLLVHKSGLAPWLEGCTMLERLAGRQ